MRPHIDALGHLLVVITSTSVFVGCPTPKAPPRADRGVEQASADITPPPPPPPRFRHCAPLSAPHPPLKSLRLAGLRLLPKGYSLTPKRPLPTWAPRRLTLGIVGEPREALVGTLATLTWLRHRFLRAHVDAIVVLGGLAPDLEGSRSLLATLVGERAPAAGHTNPPVLVLPGARSPLPGLRRAIDTSPGSLDLSVARILHLPAATILTLPCHARASHLLGGTEGCSYTPEELRRLSPSFAAAPAPRILLAHTPPRGHGDAAIDLSADTHAGSAPLAALMKRASIDFGLFGDIRESGGRATTLDGAPVKERVWTSSLLLNVGSSDALPEPTPSGRWLRPLGAIVTFKGGRARYRLLHPPPVRASALTRRHTMGYR